VVMVDAVRIAFAATGKERDAHAESATGPGDSQGPSPSALRLPQDLAESSFPGNIEDKGRGRRYATSRAGAMWEQQDA
jgi:hypothetical protein